MSATIIHFVDQIPPPANGVVHNSVIENFETGFCCWFMVMGTGTSNAFKRFYADIYDAFFVNIQPHLQAFFRFLFRFRLQRPSSQITLAREWYLGLCKDIPRCRILIFLNFDLVFLKKVKVFRHYLSNYPWLERSASIYVLSTVIELFICGFVKIWFWIEIGLAFSWSFWGRVTEHFFVGFLTG